MYDLIIRNGKIFDGTGTPSFYADIAVKDDKTDNKIFSAVGLTATKFYDIIQKVP